FLGRLEGVQLSSATTSATLVLTPHRSACHAVRRYNTRKFKATVFICFGDDNVSLPPALTARRIKRKPIESPTASTVPRNGVNKFSFLSAFLKRLLSNSAINLPISKI